MKSLAIILIFTFSQISFASGGLINLSTNGQGGVEPESFTQNDAFVTGQRGLINEYRTGQGGVEPESFTQNDELVKILSAESNGDLVFEHYDTLSSEQKTIQLPFQKLNSVYLKALLKSFNSKKWEKVNLNNGWNN